MANQWFRVWHDMPNDPKWRTIARTSGQSIPVVQSVFLQLLLSASQNVTRGHADVTLEDIASALDVTEEAVEAVIQAMQGRVLDGMTVSGWEKRQPKREDAGDPEGRAKSAAQRKREQRERERLAAENEAVTKCHGASRNVTLDTDTDTDTELNTIDTNVSIVVNGETIPDCPHQEIISLYKKNIPMGIQPKAWDGARAVALKSRWRERKERQDLAWWDKFFDYVSQSKFLTGQVVAKDRKPFEITLPWLLKPENFNKIIEGYYHR